MGASWNERIDWLRATVKNPQQALDRIREQLGPKESTTEAGLHFRLFAKLLDLREIGCQAPSSRFTEGFPTIGELAEPSVYPTAHVEAPELSRGEPMEEAKDSAAPAKGNDPQNRELWVEALRQVTRGRSEVPFECKSDGRLKHGEEAIAFNSSFRFRL